AVSVVICVSGSDGDGSQENAARDLSASGTRPPSPRPTPSPTPLPALTLAGIFPPRDPSSLHLDPSRVRTVIATGDVIPARYVDITIRNQGDDFLYPVAATRDITSAADLTVINLEAPLIDDCPYHDSGLVFCGRPGIVAALQAARVEVVTLENNHIANHGEEAVHATIQHLQPGGLHRA